MLQRLGKETELIQGRKELFTPGVLPASFSGCGYLLAAGQGDARWPGAILAYYTPPVCSKYNKI